MLFLIYPLRAIQFYYCMILLKITADAVTAWFNCLLHGMKTFNYMFSKLLSIKLKC